MGAPEPNHIVDVTDRLDLKLAALRAHESQTSHMDDLEERIRGWMTMAAERGGLPDGRLAEAFLRTTIP
jgi:LmbE family N-acetylglucosaminyl deacetylase